jgi:hypothetical protein
MPDAADPVREIAERRALLAEREAELAEAPAKLEPAGTPKTPVKSVPTLTVPV